MKKTSLVLGLCLSRWVIVRPARRQKKPLKIRLPKQVY